jgi:hypothetical protein
MNYFRISNSRIQIISFLYNNYLRITTRSSARVVVVVVRRSSVIMIIDI